MSIPESLQHQLDLFRAHGRVFREANELFAKVSWLQVMHGQGLRPASYHPLTDLLTEAEIQTYLQEIDGVIAACTEVMPTHAKFIADHCAAAAMPAAASH